MALGFEKQIIECSKLKKCGEITTMLSVGKKEFFLNCEFCDYSFLQLENFMQHICEDHLVEINQPKLEEEENEIDHYDEEIEDLETSMNSARNSEDADENEYNMRDFERVEIELDTTDIKRSIDIKEEIVPKEFISEDSMENDNFETNECREMSEHEYETSSELDYEETYNFEESDTKTHENNTKMKTNNCEEKRNFIIELIEVYHSCRALWDSKCEDYTDRLVRSQQYEILLAKYKEKYPNATKDDVRQKIFRLRTTFRRESKRISAFEKSTLYYFDAMAFLLDNEKRKEYLERRALERSELHLREMTKKTPPPETLLNDDQFITLAKIYQRYPSLWDENDIAYRFSNRRREASKAVHDEFKSETGFDIEKQELEREILRLRKTCSIEKKEKIMCKQKNIEYKPICPYYEHITFLEVDVNPFECTICGKVLNGSGLFKVHLASHDGSLPFKCHICGHGFKLATNLTVHLRRHVHDYTYSCQICNKPCATTTELKVHMRFHTGERPYVCDICGNKFQTASKFNTHMRRHENRPRHRCEVCAKGFYTKGLYREHMAVHRATRDQICDICNKGFKSPMQLRQHKRIHDAEKKYLCKICGKRFAQYAGLSGHMKSHGTKLTAKKTPEELNEFSEVFFGENSGSTKSQDTYGLNDV
ncbi:zinc finger protein 37-like [Zeugodacus cucurbitae]|uniref:Zinc finger protein 26 n=1 Tax=Zeugodacus cucurbitae TaxID=28588 RepID=A0A0A1X3F4_ZEUCU|nr:zinc finger protein 37-like [Zeugodacus cucurbitae]